MAKSKKNSNKKTKKALELVEEVVVEETDLDFLADETDEDTDEQTEMLAAKMDSENEELDVDIEDTEVDDDDELEASSESDMSGTELEDFEAADIEDVEHLTEEQTLSIVESVLFSTDKPVSVALIKQAFKGTQVKSKEIREALEQLAQNYAEMKSGITLEEVANGYQLRTKSDNMKYLRQSVKARPFRLSGPALEVLSIIAYKQPTTKAQVDEIRGVESGHLLRALMEKHIVTFGERSELPGKPMFYETTRKFLEIFGLRNLQELPSLAEIDQLIPEGIGDVEEKETLGDLTHRLSQQVGVAYSEGEDELLKITDELSQITTSSDFFEVEKQRMRDQRDKERAQDIREKTVVGEAVDEKDKRWLERYEAQQVETATQVEDVAFVTDGMAEVPTAETPAPEAIEASAADDLAADTDVATEIEGASDEMLEAADAFETDEPMAMDATDDETRVEKKLGVSDLAASAASALGAFADDSSNDPDAQA